MKIVSGILILIVAVLSFKHGWDGLRNNSPNGDANMLAWGISKPYSNGIKHWQHPYCFNDIISSNIFCRKHN